MPFFAARKVGWAGGARYRLGYPALNDYTLLLANSPYTARWAAHYYRAQCQVSYPPIDVARFEPAEKERIVLSVGRFEPERMSKRHDVLLEAFRQLHREGPLKNWRMIICGGSDGSPEFESTAASLRRSAQGLPVTVEVNVPFPRLREIYSKSSIYLHAMGIDEDPVQTPWRFEHFGMTTVEAMAAGTVPIVFSGGGQGEIVTHAENGFLWESREQLKQSIRAFVGLDGAAERCMRHAARTRALDFGFQPFYRRTCEMYRKLGVRAHEPVCASVER